MTTELVTPYFFLYDVFMKDCVRHQDIAMEVKTWERGQITGKLYQLATGLPVVIDEATGVVWGEVMSFHHPERIVSMIDRQEGYDEGNIKGSHLLREVRPVTLSSTGAQLSAYVYLFPKEKFDVDALHAVWAHGGDWRKFVMMPRFDGYQH
jgi:dipeptidyl aminopeptidase/acylaminoacyl peptidase